MLQLRADPPTCAVHLEDPRRLGGSHKSTLHRAEKRPEADHIGTMNDAAPSTPVTEMARSSIPPLQMRGKTNSPVRARCIDNGYRVGAAQRTQRIQSSFGVLPGGTKPSKSTAYSPFRCQQVITIVYKTPYVLPQCQQSRGILGVHGRGHAKPSRPIEAAFDAAKVGLQPAPARTQNC